MRAYGFLIIVMLLFSGNILVGKAAAAELPPFTLALGRALVATLAASIIFGRAAYMQRHRLLAHWRELLVIGATGIALFNACIYAALHTASAADVSVLETGIPVATALVMAAGFGERLLPRQWIGVAVSVSGALWVITDGAPWQAFSRVRTGDMIMLAAIVSWVIYSLAARRWLGRLPLYASLVPLTMLAALVLIPPAVAENVLGAQNWTLNARAIGAVVYLGLGPSLVAFLLYNYAILEVGPTRTAICLNLLPLATMGGGLVFLHEPVNAAQLIGALAVIAGVTLVVAERRR